MALFFAYFALISYKLLKLNILMVEAAGVEPEMSVENAHLIDSENARIGMISTIAKSTVRSLYGLFPEFPELPNLHLQTSPTLTKEHSEALS